MKMCQVDVNRDRQTGAPTLLVEGETVPGTLGKFSSYNPVRDGTYLKTQHALT
jgi:hypothetical protein